MVYKTKGLVLAVLAGTFGSLASVSAKLAFSFENSEGDYVDKLALVLRAVFFGGIFVFNSLMWTSFTKSLQYCDSTVEATITNTAANFIISAIVGFVFFKETFGLWWCVGMSFVIVGLALIHHGNSKMESEKKKT